MPMIPLDTIRTLLIGMGCKYLDEYDSNGWQVDFWDYYTFKDTKITFSGSLWYGQFNLQKQI